MNTLKKWLTSWEFWVVVALGLIASFALYEVGLAAANVENAAANAVNAGTSAANALLTAPATFISNVWAGLVSIFSPASSAASSTPATDADGEGNDNS